MKHPRVCKECEFWVTLAGDDGYCHRPGLRPEIREIPPGETKEPPGDGESRKKRPLRTS